MQSSALRVTHVTLPCNTTHRSFVKTAIAHAMARDGSSGGVIRIVAISKDGVEREYVPGNALPYGP
jgi:20S proteasome subunit beta 1